jgi:hypothetical protein
VNYAEHEYGYKLTVTEALETYGDLALEAVRDELRKTIQYDVFEPVHTASAPPIPSSMFLKLKLKADGTVDRLRARFVAGGHRQAWSPDDDCSSPTVAWEAVLTALAVATHSKLKISVKDVPSAYLQAELDQGPESRYIYAGFRYGPSPHPMPDPRRGVWPGEMKASISNWDTYTYYTGGVFYRYTFVLNCGHQKTSEVKCSPQF